MKHFFTLLLATLITMVRSDPQITVLPTLSKINEVNTYLFTFSVGATSLLPGTATIVFPSPAYSFNASSGITNCFDSSDNTKLFSCTLVNSSAFSFRWNDTMGESVYMSISSIKNPSYVDYYTVYFAFASDNGTAFTTISSSITNLQPDDLTSFSISFSPSYTNTLSAATISIVNKSPIPAGGSLQLTFVGYTPTSNTSSLGISVSTGSGSINTTCVSTLLQTTFKLPNFFSTAVNGGTTLVFTLSSILTPPTTASIFTIKILTYAGTNYQNSIDQKQISITGITDLPTPSLSVYTSTSSTLRVGAIRSSLLMDFKAPTLINLSTDTIVLQVSSSFTQYLLILALSTVPLSTNVTSSPFLAVNTSTGVSFPSGATSVTINTGTSTKLSGLFLSTFINSGTKTVSVQFFRSGSSYSANSASIYVSPNILLSASVTPTSTLVLSTTTYSFFLKINNPLGTGAGVVITLPTNVTIAIGTCTLSPSLSATSSLSSGISCTASGQVINVTNITSTALAANSTITLNISGITNPAVTKATNSFFFQTYYGTGQMTNPVDDSTGLSLTMTPTAITIPNSYFSVVNRADTTNMVYTTYTFTYQVYTSFPANGIITLVLPTSMLVSSGATAGYTLSSDATNRSASISNTTNSTSNKVTLTFTTGTLAANTIFTIKVSNILNYYSYKPINIQMITSSSDGFAIQQSNLAAFSLTNTAPDTTITASESNANKMNGNSITYSFAIKTPSVLYTTDLISIQLLQTNEVNTQLLYSTTPTCKVNSVTVACTQDSSNSKLLYVTVGSNFTASTTLTVSVTSITLTRSIDPPGSIKVNSLEVSGTTNYLISTCTFTPNVNSQPNLINNAKLVINDNGISSQRLNVATSFTVSFQPTNLLMTGDYIVVTIPTSDWTFKGTQVVVTNVASISSMTGSLCSDSNLFCSNYNSDSNKIRIDDKTGTAFPSSSTISFTFPSSVYVSTKSWAASYSTLTFNTYTKTNYSIDSSINSTSNTAAFALACSNTTSFHCKTCDSAGLCLSCYQTGDGVDTTWNFQAYFFRQSTGECVTSCGVQYYNSSNFCILCTAPCYSCTDGTTNSCTSCIAPTVKVNTSCASSCTPGYFNSSGVCMQCTSPCSTCVNTSTTCQSCNNGSYLNGTNCASSCSGLTGYFADNSTWTCTQCSSNCTNCSLSSSNCTACASGYFFVSGTSGTCTQSCPSGTAKLSSTVCTCDYTKCKTCSGTTTTCTSCDINLYLLNNVCNSSCGSGYYGNSSSVCVACTSNCTTCAASGCSACATSTYLYNNLCYPTCPSGTTQSTFTCIACSFGCEVCISPTVCTNCSSIYYIQINSDSTTSCVGSCSGSTPYIRGTKCVSSCYPTEVVENGYCVTSSNGGSSGSSSANSSLVSSSSKIIPMPVTIGLFTLTSVTVVSKITFHSTIVWASLSAFGGICQILVWFLFIIIASTDSTAGSLSKSGMTVVLIAYVINLILNLVSFFFFKKYIWTDDKFEYRKIKLKKAKCGLCLTYFFVVLSVIFSHKWLDVIFSNLFQAGHFIYKVSLVNILTPLNYIRYVSIVVSIIAIAGGAIAGYDTQSYNTNSFVFMESIDLIIVTIIACIFAIVATKRNADQYQKTNGLKTNDMEEHFQHDPVEDGISHFQKEEKVGNYRKKYNYSSSIRNTHDPRQNPLSKRNLSNRNPIGEEFNLTNVPLDNHEDDNNRISLNDMTGASSGIFKKTKKRINQGIDIQEIGFVEESGDSLIPSKSKRLDKNKGGNRYDTEIDRIKRENELKQSKQKQKLKDIIQSKLNQQQRQQAKVIGQVDCINTGLLSQRHGQNSDINLNQLSKNQRKKEKLQVVEGSSDENLKNLSIKQIEKAGQIKDAINLIKSKKITIDDYLQYLDIIEEQDQDKNSDDYENKNLSSKLKGKNNAKKSTNKKSKNLVKSLRKNDRRERSARYQKDPQIFVQHQNDSELGRGASFDEEKEPSQPDFHQTPIRARNQSEEFEPSELEELRLSGVRNKSDQKFKKNLDNMHDRLLTSMESGDNDDPTLAQQFQRGNTLQQVQKDQLPPSNLYCTQKMHDKIDPLKISFPSSNNATRIGPNRLINDDDNIEYIESDGVDIQTVKGQILGFENDISPSQFDQPNQRIQNQKTSNAPTKPRVKGIKEAVNDEVMDVEDLEDMDQDVYDEFEHQYQQGEPSRMQRYQSNKNLDYDQILLHKRRNERQKQLQKIYLPRLDVNRANKMKKKKMTKSVNSGRTNQK